ncbi:MAG: sigma-70 family RNA polymerase sigma factor [Firmicutes bacterium]|nr:sigma-70 family RNA polymerase sigma factor [Bacillota bacterium]
MDIQNKEQCERFLEYVIANRNQYYRLAYSFMGNEADSMDAVSQLSVVIMEKSAGIRDEAAFPAWSKRVLINICKTRLKEKKRREIPMEAPLEWAAASGGGVSQAEQLAVRQCIAALPTHYREPLLLRYYLNYEYAEIAQVLQIPEGTVKSRLHRAIGELRSQLLSGEAKKDEEAMKGA